MDYSYLSIGLFKDYHYIILEYIINIFRCVNLVMVKVTNYGISGYLQIGWISLADRYNYVINTTTANLPKGFLYQISSWGVSLVDASDKTNGFSLQFDNTYNTDLLKFSGLGKFIVYGYMDNLPAINNATLPTSEDTSSNTSDDSNNSIAGFSPMILVGISVSLIVIQIKTRKKN
jgi:hypothetical protein